MWRRSCQVLAVGRFARRVDDLEEGRRRDVVVLVGSGRKMQGLYPSPCDRTDGPCHHRARQRAQGSGALCGGVQQFRNKG